MNHVLTLEQVKAICKNAPVGRLAVYVEPLNGSFDEFDICTALEQAHFMAQAAHETNEFLWTTELASGAAYEGRTDLGNDEPGEGVRFKGRGIFQLTGDDNYVNAGTEIWGDPDLLRYNPEKAAEPEAACRIAGWYWKRNRLSAMAARDDAKGITKAINGASTDGPPSHLLRRLEYLAKAKRALGIA